MTSKEPKHSRLGLANTDLPRYIMTSHLHDDGIGKIGLGVSAFALRMGLSVVYVTKLCRDGKIFGARKHPLTKKWWIYPPAKLLYAHQDQSATVHRPRRVLRC